MRYRFRTQRHVPTIQKNTKYASEYNSFPPLQRDRLCCIWHGKIQRQSTSLRHITSFQWRHIGRMIAPRFRYLTNTCLSVHQEKGYMFFVPLGRFWAEYQRSHSPVFSHEFSIYADFKMSERRNAPCACNAHEMIALEWIARPTRNPAVGDDIDNSWKKKPLKERCEIVH